MRDIRNDRTIIERFKELPSFGASLVRNASARQLANARSRSRQKTPAHAFNFKCKLHGFTESHSIDIDFRAQPKIFDRIIALAGNNGTGKSGVLAHLAYVASGERPHSGTFSPEPPSIRRVIVVSYSSFQPFKSETTDSDTYRFCGFSGAPSQAAKDASLGMRFRKAFQEASQPTKQQLLGRIWETLAKDAQITERQTPGLTEALGIVSQLSSGHRIFIQIMVEVLAGLEPGSLLLIDEPELHLHPTLIATLMRGVSSLLKAFDSHAIIATHSPIVLQQIPSSHVRVFRRQGSLPRIESPRNETFCANLAEITDDTFECDTDDKNYLNDLKAATRGRNEATIRRRFVGRPSVALELFLRTAYRR
jgi:predicted ATPase